MVRCCVPGCHNNTSGQKCSTAGPHSFFRIPENPSIVRGHWLRNIKRDIAWAPAQQDRVCSDHFEDHNLEVTKGGKPRVKKGGFPTVFPAPEKRKSATEPSINISPVKKRICTEEIGDLDDSFSLLELQAEQDQRDIVLQPENLQQKIMELETQLCLAKAKNMELEAELEARDDHISELEKLLYLEDDEPILGAYKLESCKNDVFRRMTGVVNYTAFVELCNIFAPAMAASNQRRHQNSTPRPDRRKLSAENQFLLVLFKLRMDLTMEFLGIIFKIHKTTVGRIFEMWINTMAHVIRLIDYFPSREQVKLDAPVEFLSSGYGDVRVIVDCFELFTETSSHPGTQSYAFSNYKHHATVKFMVGITPSAKISFISRGALGGISDQAILSRSGLLDILEPGDTIMADKGFTLSAEEAHRGIKLLVPDFLGQRTQLSPEEANNSYYIARHRVHVERSITRITDFRILSPNIPLALVPFLDEILEVIIFLVNSSTEILPKKPAPMDE